METFLLENAALLRSIVDTVPSMMFIVDSDVRIYFANTAAQAAVGDKESLPYKIKGGDALHCINSTLTPAGCGHSEPCKDCIIRNSVTEALAGGKISRRNTVMKLKANGITRDVCISVSASPFPYNDEQFILLLLEDITEVMNLRSILPICMHCKKIRSDSGYWHRVENYFHSHTGVDFTHSICPDCLKELYPEIYPHIKNGLE